MAAPFMGADVKAYANSLGLLKEPAALGLWEWRLNEAELAKARSDWENSGLVLSAEREPLQFG